MVRMSDLLKKMKGEIREPAREPRKNKKKEPPKLDKEPKAPVEPAEEKKPARPPEEVTFASLISEHGLEERSEKEAASRKLMEPSRLKEENVKKIYFEALESIKIIFDTYKNGGEIDKADVMNIAQKILNNVLTGSDVFLRLFHELDSLESYTCYNAVNVSVLSVEIGLVYNCSKAALLNLSVIGLLHDIELMKSKHIIDKPDKLDAGELKEIMKHPMNVATYVDNAFKLSKDVVNAILQHHERESGQGYPAGITNGDIQDLAAIVGIADTYEAMTHSRPHKEKMPPHEAVLNIVKSGKALFSKEAVKALIACVGLYPIGSWVVLNTGETCKVFAVDPDFPLRPVVSIYMDKDSNKLKEARTINLREVPSLYIARIAEGVNVSKSDF